MEGSILHTLEANVAHSTEKRSDLLENAPYVSSAEEHSISKKLSSDMTDDVYELREADFLIFLLAGTFDLRAGKRAIKEMHSLLTNNRYRQQHSESRSTEGPGHPYNDNKVYRPFNIL